MKHKRTKIVCTIGPSSSSVSVLSRMIDAGMNVARLNFSHGSYKDHATLFKHIRQASKRTGQRVAILQDLQGPKIRVGSLPEDGVNLRKGQEVQFSTAIEEYKAGGAMPVTYKNLHKDIKVGEKMLMDDGLLEAKCEKVRGKVITAKMTVGGVLKSHKGINLPDSKLSVSAFTKKDHEDLLFGLEQGVDWVALSFVTSREVVDKVSKIISARCRSLRCVRPKIIVKIERKQAVENFAEILDAADGIMLARGDLGIEIPFEEVPILQKEFIEICRQTGKPIVVATHMMDSMTHNRRATRAEVSDVANAVIDHADAVMLSQESAVGDYPVVAVQSMSLIIGEAENSRLDDITFLSLYDIPDIGTSIAQSLHMMAENDQIDFIVTSSTYGDIAQKINVFRPNVPIVLACPNDTVARQMMMRAGVYAEVVTDEPGTFVHRMESLLRRKKMIATKDRVAYVTSTPKGEINLTIR